MDHYAIAFRINSRITLADFERIWNSLISLGVTLDMGSWEVFDGQLYLEGGFSGTDSGFRRIEKYCARTGGLEIDYDTMEDWY